MSLDNASKEVDAARRLLLDAFEAWVAKNSTLGGISRGDGFGDDTGGLEGGEEEDPLDFGEKFDQLELARVAAADPDSLAFFNAKKNLRGKNKHELEKTLKSKRLHK